MGISLLSSRLYYYSSLPIDSHCHRYFANKSKQILQRCLAYTEFNEYLNPIEYLALAEQGVVGLMAGHNGHQHQSQHRHVPFVPLPEPARSNLGCYCVHDSREQATEEEKGR